MRSQWSVADLPVMREYNWPRRPGCAGSPRPSSAGAGAASGRDNRGSTDARVYLKQARIPFFPPVPIPIRASEVRKAFFVPSSISPRLARSGSFNVTTPSRGTDRHQHEPRWRIALTGLPDGRLVGEPVRQPKA